jgi:hypothetical protein
VRRIQHCGRFAFWALPFGPWRCSACDRALAAGPMPRSAIARFWDAVEELPESPPLTPAQLELVHIVARQTLSPGEVLSVDLPGHGVVTFRRRG